MKQGKQYVLSVAGFDPSGGAGLLADIKTFERLGVYGLGAITANTFQDDVHVKRVDWMPLSSILDQIDLLLERFEVNFFKIGIVRNTEYLSAILKRLISKKPLAFIVWDPVIRSSSGSQLFEHALPRDEILSKISLITPNLAEFELLFPTIARTMEFSYRTMVYLKGGHSADHPGRDLLFSNGRQQVFEPGENKLPAKHGSGCVLSSALCAYLALGNQVEEACRKSKRYIEDFLSSDPGLLGWHHQQLKSL
jgi:hydroxymethylpyrimidine/phosphomethylpyrimidine kinase